MELVGGGVAIPTAEQVAKQAEVGIRTVFRHFADMEALYNAMADRLDEQERPYIAGGRRTGSFEERSRNLIKRRTTAYDRMGPYLRAAKLKAPSSTVISSREVGLARELRRDILDWLPELYESPVAVVDALDMAISFESWDRMRFELKLSRQRSIQAIEVIFESLTGDYRGK